MSTFLTLLLVCWAAHGVSSAATPLLFMFEYNDSEVLGDALPTTDRTLKSGTSIHFPGEVSGDSGSGDPGQISSSGDANPDSVVLPGGLNRVNKPIQPTGDCVLSDTMTMSYNGTTWKILHTDKCPEGEWVVMIGECQPACRPRPCPHGQLEYLESCVDPTDPTVCGEEQILYLDTRGSTYCDCEKNHFYHPWSGQCYARREQGRCDFGFFMDINENNEVDCMPNDCKVDGFEMDYDSGRCFRKDFEGYCPVDSLQFHHNNLTVGCELLDIRNLFDSPITRSCEPGSRINHLGKCRQEIVVPSITSLPRSLTGGCRSGAIRVGSGPCRRLNSYIG